MLDLLENVNANMNAVMEIVFPCRIKEIHPLKCFGYKNDEKFKMLTGSVVARVRVVEKQKGASQVPM